MIKRFCAWSALVLLAGACRGPGSVPAAQVFPDPRVTPLAEAAASGDARRIAQWAAEDVDVNARGDKGTNLLQWALLNRNTEGITALLDAGANPAQADDEGKTVMHFAALANDPAYLELLLASGADPNTPDGVTGATPIVAALMGQREQQFQMLLQAECRSGRADRTGNTPLHMAAKINAYGPVLALLEAGAPPEARNQQGATFQPYLFMTSEHVLFGRGSPGPRRGHRRLRRHGIAVAGSAER